MKLGRYEGKYRVRHRTTNALVTKQYRDGTPQRYDPTCENHGGCPACEGSRLHKHKRAMPIEEWDHDTNRK